MMRHQYERSENRISEGGEIIFFCVVVNKKHAVRRGYVRNSCTLDLLHAFQNRTVGLWWFQRRNLQKIGAGVGGFEWDSTGAIVSKNITDSMFF